MKTRFERYCELRNFDNWCLQHPRKSNLLALAAGLVIFGFSQLLQHIPPELLSTLLFGALLWFAFAGGQE